MDTNNANPPNSGASPNDGTYQPDVLVHNKFLAPANYELNATMRANDDDLMGLVWNYQDPNNYFRLGLRQQPASGNFGGTRGLIDSKNRERRGHAAPPGDVPGAGPPRSRRR